MDRTQSRLHVPDARPSARSIDDLAAAVVCRLADAGRPDAEEARPHLLRRLAEMVLTRGPYEPDVVLAYLRRYRVSDPAIITVYVPQAARMLGEMWVVDGLGFAEVSVGTARLQAMVRRIEDDVPQDAGRPADAPAPLRLMIVVPGDEQHTLGAVALAVLRRRAGDEVTLRFNPPAESLCRDLEQSDHDALILSCATEEGLEVAIRLLSRLRRRLRHAPVLALGGPALSCLAGADAGDADVATNEFAVVEKLARSRRAGWIGRVE